MKKYVTEYIKTKELHKHFCYIFNETTFEKDTSLAKNSEAIEKSVTSPNSNNIASTTTSTSPFTSLARNSEAFVKSVKSPKSNIIVSATASTSSIKVSKKRY